MNVDSILGFVLLSALLIISVCILCEVRVISRRTKNIKRRLQSLSMRRIQSPSNGDELFSLKKELYRVTVAMTVWAFPLLLFSAWYLLMGGSPDVEVPSWIEKFLEHNLAVQVAGIELLLLIFGMLLFLLVGAEDFASIFQEEIATVCYHTTTFFLCMSVFVAVVRRHITGQLAIISATMACGIILAIGLVYGLSEATLARKRKHDQHHD